MFTRSLVLGLLVLSTVLVSPKEARAEHAVSIGIGNGGFSLNIQSQPRYYPQYYYGSYYGGGYFMFYPAYGYWGYPRGFYRGLARRAFFAGAAFGAGVGRGMFGRNRFF